MKPEKRAIITYLQIIGLKPVATNGTHILISKQDVQSLYLQGGKHATQTKTGYYHHWLSDRKLWSNHEARKYLAKRNQLHIPAQQRGSFS